MLEYEFKFGVYLIKMSNFCKRFLYAEYLIKYVYFINKPNVRSDLSFYRVWYLFSSNI